jgi:hypothetical protein
MDGCKPLDAIPNHDGFLFVGVLHDGRTLRCRVALQSDGVHRALSRADGVPVFADLAGWRDDPEEGVASLLRVADLAGAKGMERTAARIRHQAANLRRRLIASTTTTTTTPKE